MKPADLFDFPGGSGIRRRGGNQPVLAAMVAFFLFSIAAARPAGPQEILTQLRQFRYGEDASALTEVEKQVAAVAANAADSVARQRLAESLASLLETDAPYEAKQFVCRQLALIGTAGQVPILARLLTDEKLSDMARYALGPIPDPSVDQALRDALDHTSGKTQAGIINTVGFRRDAAAVGRLGQLLDATDPATVSAAASALGRIGGAQVVPMLDAALRRANAGTRFPIADALLACLDDLVAQGKGGESAAVYEELFRTGQPSQIRVAALRGMVTARGTAGVSLAVSALRDADPLVKRAAIGCVQRLPGADATRQFAAELPRLSPSEQTVLLGALANRGDAVALPAVTAAAKSADPQIRTAGLAALGRLGDASVVDLLVTAATGSSGTESAVALTSLRALPGEGVDQAVVKSLESAPASARPPLIRVLADRQAADAVPALLRLAADADERTAAESFKALAPLAEPANLAALLNLLAGARTDAPREAAEVAVVAVSRRISDESKQAGPVLAALREEPREAVRCSLLRVLGGIGGADARAALLQATRTDSGPMRDAAVRALADWANPADAEALLSVFRNAENPTQRILLLRGLARLMGPDSTPAPGNKLDICRQVMKQARGTDEIRQALSLLATVSDPQALQLVEPCLKEDAVREEAAMAAVKIAGPMAAAHPDLVRPALQTVLAVSQNDTVKRQAQAVLQALEKNEGFISAWQVAGPFTQPGKTGRELFDIAFPPERAEDKSTVWRTVSLDLAKGQTPMLDLMTRIGGSQRAAYLRTWIHSDQEQKGRLEIGSDDGVKAWLNGVVVHANNADRGLVVGEDKAPVTLRQGWNLLLLKITQGEGGWGACARLRDPQGSRLANVRLDCAHEETPGPAK